METKGRLRQAERDDGVLMAALGRGEMDALGELYLRHGGAVSRFVGSVLEGEDRAHAEDLVQEVFLTALDRSGEYDDRGKLQIWLVAIARRKIVAFRRKRWVRRRLFRRYTAERKVVVSLASQKEPGCDDLERCAAEAIEALPERQRQVLLLAAVEGFDGREIGRALGVSYGAARVLLHRARASVAEALSAAGFEPPMGGMR